MPSMLAQFENARIKVQPLLAVSRAPGRTARPNALYLTPGADVAATLEGRR